MGLEAFPDAGRALWRAIFLHFPMSVPFAVGALIFPAWGYWYEVWRHHAEEQDEAEKSDSPAKAAMDYWSQTALVALALRVRGYGPK